ncbi:MAG: alpha/beta fold hydrolase [Rhodobacteraceae bacterium]|nr:alpha/beta fold hydrolase [Paracoccaceae bacterium]
MAIRITRHFVTVGGTRQVHYRRAGEGPPIVLLHQSPTSSREYIPLIEEIAAKGYTVIAPDTPGNGLSEPLPLDKEWPTMEDFADGVANVMTELGIDKAPVYGFHTGGACALALGLRHPGRVTVCIMDGYIQMDEAETAEILANYLPELKYDWSGSHLTWTWARFREQLIFFPWYRKDTARRMNNDLPPPAGLQIAVMDFLRADNNYRKAYRPAFLLDTASAVKNMKANMVITTTATDVLTKYMDVMPNPPANVRTFRPATRDDAKDNNIKLLIENPSPHKSLPLAATKPMPGRLWCEYLQIDGGSLYSRRNTDGKGRPIVMIHASAASSMGMDRFMKPLIGKRPVLAVDLPGNGESDNPMGTTVTVEAQAKYLALAIEAAGYDEVDVFGYWGGCDVGVELAIQNPDLVKHLAVPTLMFFDDATRDEYVANYTPTIEYEEFGAHWIKVWNMVRDQELFTPWYKRKKEHIRRAGEPDVAPEVIHRRTLDLFKCIDIYQSAYRAHFMYPSLKKLAQVGCPVLLGNPDSAATKQALATAKNATAKAIPADFAVAAGELLAFFG